MTEEQMDMSLDDIIKAKPSMVKRGRRGGRGGESGGGGRGSGGSGGGGGGGARGGRGRGGRGRRGNSGTPYSRETPTGRWRHDKFNGGRSEEGGGGGGRGIAKLLISNLEYSVNDQDIRELFGEFGPIRTYSVHYDRSGRSLGTADVTYINKSDAARALKTYNNVPLDGKAMVIELVTDEAPSFGGNRSFGNNNFRQQSSPNRSRGGRGGRGRGRGGNSNRTPKKQMTAEELDKQLDEYKTKA